MPRKPKPPIECDDEERQPTLLDVPEEPHLVEMAKEYRHTAKTTLKDGPRCFYVCELLMRGVGVERICRLVKERFPVGISPHTVREIRDLLHGGKLDGWKHKASRKGKELVDLASDGLMEDLLAGRVSPFEKIGLVKVFSEQIATWDGEAGLIVEHRHQKVLNLGAVDALLKALPDSASGELPPIPEEIRQLAEPGPVSGLVPGPDQAIDDQVGSRRPEPVTVAPVTVAPTRAEGGGGVLDSKTGGRQVDESASAKFSATDPPSP